jgi:hypothetical protein
MHDLRRSATFASAISPRDPEFAGNDLEPPGPEGTVERGATRPSDPLGFRGVVAPKDPFEVHLEMDEQKAERARAEAVLAERLARAAVTPWSEFDSERFRSTRHASGKRSARNRWRAHRRSKGR